MAKSTARKLRERMVREGKYDPANSRGSWHGVNPQLKVLPNKKKDAKDKGYDHSRVLRAI